MDSIAVALAAGLVAAFNPCGFALLPSFLAMLVSGSVGVLRALRLSAAMTAGFVTVFGAIGFVISVATAPIQQHLPWVTVVTGVVLAGLGCWMLSGRELSLPVPRLNVGGPVRLVACPVRLRRLLRRCLAVLHDRAVPRRDRTGFRVR